MGISLVVNCFLAVCTNVTLLIVSLLLYIVIFPIRQVVNVLFFYKFKNRFKIMEPIDAIFYKDFGPSSMMMTSCFLAQIKFNPENLEKLRSKLHSKIVNSSRNYQKLMLVPRLKFGFHCWEDVQFLGGFDIQAHVKLFPGEDAWNKIYSETQLESILNKVINQRTLSSGDNAPKWEVLVVPQVRAKTSAFTVAQTHVAVIVRASHAYMDGNYFAQFVQNCICDDEKDSKTPAQPRSKRTNWNFSRGAAFYLKMLLFGNFEAIKIRFSEGIKATRIFQKGVGNENNGHAFIGKVKVESDTVHKIRRAANCQTIGAVFFTAFSTALRTFAERQDVEVPRWLNVALTKVLAAGAASANDKAQNNFALYARKLPFQLKTECSKDTIKEILTTTDNLINMSPDNEYEASAGFYMAYLIGLLPDVGIRAMELLYDFCSCLISITPVSDQMFQFQGGLVTSAFGVPPYGYGTCYSLGISNYGKTFVATLLVEKSSLVKSQFEFQELLRQFQECITQLQDILC